MQVLQINSVCGSGSTGRITVDLYKILKEEGHDGFVAYGRGKAPGDVKTIEIGNFFYVCVHGILSRITDKHGFYSKKATYKLIEKIDKYSPNVIHLHNIHGYYLNIEILFEYLKTKDIPIVWTLHDCWAFTGHCSYFDNVGCNKWKSGCNECPQKKSYPRSMLIDNSKFNYQMKKELFTSVNNMVLVVPSMWLSDLVKESFLSKYNIKIIQNGIDLNVFKPTASDFRKRYNIEDKFVLLGVANVWDERKGLKDFVELSKFLDDSYKIVLVGLSKNQIKELPHKIIGISRTKNTAELAEIYTASDIYINTSVEETMGLTTVEALACGKPAIVYNSTAVPEVIDSSCGITVNKGSIKSIYDEIQALKENMIFKSKNCIERAKRFDKNNKFQEYVDLYRSL